MNRKAKRKTQREVRALTDVISLQEDLQAYAVYMAEATKGRLCLAPGTDALNEALSDVLYACVGAATPWLPERRLSVAALPPLATCAVLAWNARIASPPEHLASLRAVFVLTLRTWTGMEEVEALNVFESLRSGLPDGAGLHRPAVSGFRVVQRGDALGIEVTHCVTVNYALFARILSGDTAGVDPEVVAEVLAMRREPVAEAPAPAADEAGA